MLRRFLFGLLIISLITFGSLQENIGHAAPQSGDSSNLSLRVNNQTVPTRTPTPGPTSPPRPTATKSSGGSPTDAPTAVPTSTGIAQPTVTATAIAIATTTIPTTLTLIPTMENGSIPTAEPCSNQPTILANNPINVRTGPNANEAIVIKLAYLDVRPIIGRAADTAWWQILIADGQSGWVADAVVTVNGYTGNVPITDGDTPSSWNPTPNPLCTVTPTAVASETASVTGTPTTTTTAAPVAEETNDPVAAATNESGADVSSSTAAPQPTQTAVAPPTLVPTSSPADTEPINLVQTDGEETAVFETVNQEKEIVALDDTITRSATDFLLPAAGILLLAAGAVSALTRRRPKS